MSLVGITLILASIFGFNQTSLASEDSNKPFLLETKFNFLEHLNDSDSLLVMPDGGFLHGTATTSNYGDGEILGYYNSDTDGKATTVGTVKKIFSEISEEEGNLFNSKLGLTRGTKPSSTVISLGLGASYSSSKFSASGIRFAGYLFQTKGTAGDRLRYYSYNTVGAAGSKTDAQNVYSSQKWNAYGKLVYSSTYTYVGGVSTYWVNNPKAGTYYYVKNK